MESTELRKKLLGHEEVTLPPLRESRALTNTAGPVPSDALADMSVELYDSVADFSAAESAGVMFTETPDGTSYPVIVTGTKPGARIAGENVEVIETRNASFARFYLGAHKYVSSVVVPNELFADSYLADFSATLARLAAEAIAREYDPDLVAGSGTNEPAGLRGNVSTFYACLLYTSDAADE